MIGWDLTHKPFAFVHTFYAMLSLLVSLVKSNHKLTVRGNSIMTYVICNYLRVSRFNDPFFCCTFWFQKMTMRNAKPHKKRFQKLIKKDSNSFFSNCKQKYLLITFLKDISLIGFCCVHICSIFALRLHIRTVFENQRKSLIQHCERSELRLHFEWTKVN